jgi:hypothetical protein
MECWNSPQALGSVAVDVLRHNFHQPIKNGKCNRENIEDAILEGVYSGELQAMNQADVKFVCDLIDDIIESYTPKKKVD